MKRAYISGPITGMPLDNRAAFDLAEKVLRSAGYQVHNPTSQPRQRCWEDYMRVDLRHLLQCDVVVTLEGWQRSRGASLEVYVATQVGILVREINEVVRELNHGPLGGLMKTAG